MAWDNVLVDASTVCRRLQDVSADLATLGVKSLSIFGSTVRGDATDASDLDFLVEFEGPASFAGYMALKELLEDIFGRQIDLVTHKALKPALKQRILDEAVKVA